MYAVGIDTSHQFLVISLMNEDGVIDGIQLNCFKQQSEYLVPELKKLLEKHGIEMLDVDKWIVTEGPGSYTGVRIGMTLAKVAGSLENKDVYTLSTLQLYAGKKDCYVIMDARAKRCYIGKYSDGKPLMEDTAWPNTEVEKLIDTECVIGDLHLFGKEDKYGNLCQNFFDLRDCWKKVEKVDLLTPKYLKSNEDYLK